MSFSVSIVIPTYNRKNSLNTVLCSLVYQNYKNFEVIIIDDGSTDETNKMVDNWKSRLNINYFSLTKTKGTGASHSRNYGIDKSKGDIVIFIDSDSLVNQYFVEEHVRCHLICNHLAVVSIRWQLKTAIVDEAVIRKNCPLEILEIDKLDTQNRVFNFFSYNLGQFNTPWWFFSTSNASVRRDDLINIGKFDENFCDYILYEDTELAFRLFKYGVKFIMNKKAPCYHLYHPINLSQKLDLSYGNVDYFCSKYPNDPEICELKTIKKPGSKNEKDEEHNWFAYMSSVNQDKKRNKTKINYLVPVQNQWNELEKWLKILSAQPNIDEVRVIVMDMNSSDNTDVFIQQNIFPFRLEYWPSTEMDLNETIKQGKRKVMSGELKVVNL